MTAALEISLPGGQTRLVRDTAVLGRAPDRPGTDHIALDDPMRSASKNHASVRPLPGAHVEVTDLGSTNGTTAIIDGHSMSLAHHTAITLPLPARIKLGDIEVTIAEHVIDEATISRPTTTTATTHSPWSPDTGSTPARETPPTPTTSPPPSRSNGGTSATEPILAVRSLVVDTNGHRRLDHVDFDAFGGEMIGVLGTSGAGKSTFIKAVAGIDPASSGEVRLNGIDVYLDFPSVRDHIGYVPQDDILHPTLTIRETLTYAARLRLPLAGPDERDQRVNEVIDELGLTPRADAKVNELSGGQRKRVNVAVELLTSPTLLILDEPTSGLDPGNERIAMDLFRSLATDRRVVLVVTHSTESLSLCDRVVLMAAGGVKIYDGAPTALSTHFGNRPLNEVFAMLEQHTDTNALRVPGLAPLAPIASVSLHEPTRLVDRIKRADIGRILHQFNVLSERYVRVIESDRKNSTILVAQGLVIAFLMLIVFGSDALGSAVNSNAASKSGNVLMALTLASIYLGASNAVREIVKERAIFRREFALGVSPAAYLASKVVPLGALTIAQAAVLVIVGTIRQGVPHTSATFLPAMTEVFLIVAGCGISALCLGLLISASTPSADRAMTILPVVLFAQLLLVGLIFPVSTIGVQQLAWLTAAYWGFGGAAATVDFERRYCVPQQQNDPTFECAWLWDQSAFNWIFSYGALCVLGVAALFFAWRALDRADPAQVLQRRNAELQSASATVVTPD